MKKKRKCFNCGYWNAGDALYCCLCYEPFTKRPRRPAPEGAGAAPGPVPQAALTAALLWKAAALALLLAAGFYAFRNLTPSGGADPAEARQLNRFKEKTDAADRLFADYAAAKNDLLNEISAGPLDPEGFGIAGDYTTKLFDIEQRYAEGIEALDLPGAGEVHKKADAFYLEWLEIHQYKESSAIMDFSRKYQVLIEKAGAGA